jgi:hypothetical protein
VVLVATADPGGLSVIEPNGGRLRHVFPLAGAVAALAPGRSGEYAAALDPAGEVAVFDLVREVPDAHHTIAGTGRASGVAFVDRLTRLAVAFDGAGEVVVLRRESGRIDARVPTGAAHVLALVSGHRSGEVLAALGAPEAIAWIDVDAATVTRRVDLPGRPLAVGRGSPTEGAWALVEDAGRVRLWNERTGAVADLAGRGSLTTAAPSGVAVASDPAAGGIVVAADGATFRIPVRAPAAAGTEWPVAVDPEGRNAFVAIPDEDRVVSVDLHERRVRGAYAGLGNPQAVAWSLRRELPGDGGDEGGR